MLQSFWKKISQHSKSPSQIKTDRSAQKTERQWAKNQIDQQLDEYLNDKPAVKSDYEQIECACSFEMDVMGYPIYYLEQARLTCKACSKFN